MEYVVAGILAVVASLVWAYRRAARWPARGAARRFHHAEMVRVLLGLEGELLDDLLKLYGEQYGRGAARYARRTLRKWKAGEVRPNRQTFERLLVRLPEVMSFDMKCEVLRKLREEYCPKDDHQLTVYTDDWKETLAPLVTSIIERAYTAELPGPVEKRLRWLAGDEMSVARALLAESQARESRNAVSMLRREFSNIEHLLDNARGESRVTHRLELPYGTVTLKVKRRQPSGR